MLSCLLACNIWTGHGYVPPLALGTAEFVKLLVSVFNFFGFPVFFLIIYEFSIMFCSINLLPASGGAGRPQ